MNKKITIGIIVAIILITSAILVTALNKNDNTTKNIDQFSKNKPSDNDNNELNEPTSIVNFVQITSMHLDAGEQTFEAFRITLNDMVEWARWNSSGYLLNHSEPHAMNNKIFNKIVSSSSFLNPPKPPQEDGVLGRPGFSLDITTHSDLGVKAVSMTKMPDDIAIIINELRRDIKAMPVQPGWYIWTQPHSQISKSDIDISEGKRDSAVSTALLEAVATDRLIVRADDSIQQFISGERAYRIAFEASLENGNLLFGVLVAK